MGDPSRYHLLAALELDNFRFEFGLIADYLAARAQYHVTFVIADAVGSGHRIPPPSWGRCGSRVHLRSLPALSAVLG